jgi:cell division protein FtsW (lipid II flippase)
VNNNAQIVAIIINAGFLLLVIELVRRRRLAEEYSFIWLFCAASMLSLAAFRGSLDTVARWLDVYYPPSLLLMVLGLFVFGAALYFTVVLSDQRKSLTRLMEDTAILTALISDLRAERNRSRKGEGPIESNVGAASDSTEGPPPGAHR